jgi:hypothetical protein
MLHDPSQEGGAHVTLMKAESVLWNSNWRAVRDPDFRAKQRTMLEEARGNTNTQINLILAGGMRGCTRYSQEDTDAKKRKARTSWIRDVERLQKH